MGMRSVAFAVAVLALTTAAKSAVIVYQGVMSGLAESPPNGSPGIGFAEVDWNTTANTMRVQVSFSGLLGTTTASHIHAATALPGTGTAGVATTTPTFTSFPLGVTSGTYDFTYDMTASGSYNASYVTANGGTTASAETAFKASLDAGTSYLNIHSTVVPGGEIRGFLVAVPEPASLGVLGSFGMLLMRRRRG